jgi:hypothetical protein
MTGNSTTSATNLPPAEATAASSTALPPIAVFRPDQGGAYYLDGDLIFVGMTAEGLLDFADETVCDAFRCDPEVAAVQRKVTELLQGPDLESDPGRVMVWLADPGDGRGCRTYWLGKPCLDCGSQGIYDPHTARLIPCSQPEAHVAVCLSNWRSLANKTAAVGRRVSMTVDELHGRYGADALAVAADESPAIGHAESPSSEVGISAQTEPWVQLRADQWKAILAVLNDRDDECRESCAACRHSDRLCDDHQADADFDDLRATIAARIQDQLGPQRPGHAPGIMPQ